MSNCICVCLESAKANHFLKRTLFHPGSTKCEEQKREAREDYEERCEPSFPLFRNTGSGRFCPDIHHWQEFDNYEIGNGYEQRRSTTPDGGNKERYNDRNQQNTKRPRRPTTEAPDHHGDQSDETHY